MSQIPNIQHNEGNTTTINYPETQIKIVGNFLEVRDKKNNDIETDRLDILRDGNNVKKIIKISKTSTADELIEIINLAEKLYNIESMPFGVKEKNILDRLYNKQKIFCSDFKGNGSVMRMYPKSEIEYNTKTGKIELDCSIKFVDSEKYFKGKIQIEYNNKKNIGILYTPNANGGMKKTLLFKL